MFLKLLSVCGSCAIYMIGGFVFYLLVFVLIDLWFICRVYCATGFGFVMSYFWVFVWLRLDSWFMCSSGLGPMLGFGVWISVSGILGVGFWD